MAIAKALEVQILEVSQGRIEVCIIGNSPMIYNRMSEKARQQLLFPSGRKTAADKAIGLKHDPLNEFRNSPYTSIVDGPTRIQALGSMFKKAMMTAALDLPGVQKAQIGRLVYVIGDRINLFGTPQIMLAVTRSSDIARTPDIRSRAILPRWACKITIAFVKPVINEKSVMNLLAAGGNSAGIGDWRVEKGSGSYGQYRICAPSDPEFLSIMKEGRIKQDQALKKPLSYDDETRDLLDWFETEVDKRGKRKDLTDAAA